MEKKQTQFMDLNRETAMRLWSKSFGKETKVKDFTGREIAKGAYNDRNSEYGWNVDHILPQSRGGKTADHNLICCHILTNDEKADKFPCFVANKLKFEIVKVENHYEIKQVAKSPGALIGTIFSTLGSMICNSAIAYFVLASFTETPGMNLWDIICTCHICELAVALVPLPGGSGATELSFNALLGALFPDGTLFWGILIWRILTYYIYIIEGWLLFGWDFVLSKIYNKKEIREKNQKKIQNT